MSRKLHPYTRGVAHHVRHRTRLRLPPSHRNQIALRSAEKAILSVPGVKSTEVKERTGSIVIHHDEKDNILEHIGDALAKAVPELFELLIAEEEAEVEGLSFVATLLGAGASVANREMARKTDNWLNMKVIIPLAFLAAGIRKGLQNEAWMAEVPAFVLIYYAFDSYMKFHPMVPPALVEHSENGHDLLPDQLDKTKRSNGGGS